MWMVAIHTRTATWISSIALFKRNESGFLSLQLGIHTACFHWEQIQLTTLICSSWGRTEYFGDFYAPFLKVSKQCSNIHIQKCIFCLSADAHVTWTWHTCIETNVTHLWMARTPGVTYFNVLKMQSPETNILKQIFSCSDYKSVLLHPSELFSVLTALWHCWWNSPGCFQKVSISPVFNLSRHSLKEKIPFFGKTIHLFLILRRHKLISRSLGLQCESTIKLITFWQITNSAFHTAYA